jgi:hypothetical protein
MAQKKSFKADLNPAMQFISTQAAEETPAPIREETPTGYRVNPLFIEKRSKRLQLLVQPSLYDQIKERADAEGCSVNDLIHRLLENAVKGE